MRRRYKLLLIIFISFLLVFFSYFLLRKDKYIYVALGDDLSFNNFSTYNYIEYIKYNYENLNVYKYAEEYNTSEDLYHQITQNVGDINYYLKNANIVTISLGTVELNNYKELNEEVLINYLNNVYILLNKLSKLNNHIFLINMYDDSYSLVNKKLNEYCKLYNIYYIQRSDINESYIYLNNLKTYLNYQGHKQISDIIVKEMANQK
ncbi:MAG: hypothetical protein IJO63_02090 [Bacilli bacterium]|nr:hypothetical protein [Bacilli bacterium]